MCSALRDPAVSLFLAPAIGFAVLAAQAQTAPARQPFRSAVDVVTVDVSAIDSGGRPVTGLTADDFELRVEAGRAGSPRRNSSACRRVRCPPRRRARALQHQRRGGGRPPDHGGGRSVEHRQRPRQGRDRRRQPFRQPAQSRRSGGARQHPARTAGDVHGRSRARAAADSGDRRHRHRQPRRAQSGDRGCMAFERRSDVGMAAVYDRECGSLRRARADEAADSRMSSSARTRSVPRRS